MMVVVDEHDGPDEELADEFVGGVGFLEIIAAAFPEPTSNLLLAGSSQANLPGMNQIPSRSRTGYREWREQAEMLSRIERNHMPFLWRVIFLRVSHSYFRNQPTSLGRSRKRPGRTSLNLCRIRNGARRRTCERPAS